MEGPNLAHFHLFPNLPPELRLQIWELALPRSRVLKVSVDIFDASKIALLGPYSPIPSILHICHESRSLALSKLRLGFGPSPYLSSPSIPVSGFSGENNNEFYWNPELDTIYFPPSASWTNGNLSSYLSLSTSSSLPKNYINAGIAPITKHLALPLNLWLMDALYFSDNPCNRWMLPWLSQFPCLETLTLLIEPYDQWLGSPDTAPVFYEPLDVPIRGLHLSSPSSISSAVQTALHNYHQSKTHQDLPQPTRQPPRKQKRSPEVKVQTISHRKFHSCKECIEKTSNLDREDITGVFEVTRETRVERKLRWARSRWPEEVHTRGRWSLVGI